LKNNTTSILSLHKQLLSFKVNQAKCMILPMLANSNLAFGYWDDILLKNNSKASSMQERGGGEEVWGCNIHVLWKLSVGTMPSYHWG
jgi:hypothetical protein